MDTNIFKDASLDAPLLEVRWKIVHISLLFHRPHKFGTPSLVRRAVCPIAFHEVAKLFFFFNSTLPISNLEFVCSSVFKNAVLNLNI